MAEEKAVLLEHLEIVKNYIDSKDVKNIKSAEFVDDALKFYASEDKSGETVAEFTLPEEMFLDGSKTEFVRDFSWSITKYPKSTDPNLDGKPVLVLAVKSKRTVRYSFISLDSVITRLVGGDTDSTSVSIANDVVTLSVKVSELSDNRVVLKDDGLYVGVVDNTPAWTVSTNEEVGELFSVGSSPSFGINTLGTRNVGDIVQIMEDGEPTDFIVVHKGNPDPEIYDASCDGVWLLRKMAYSRRAWNSININDYEESEINAYLNEEYLDNIDPKVGITLKDVKIPYKKGCGGDSFPVLIGENGLPCRAFLLSSNEVGLSTVDYVSYIGTKLDYFIEGYDDELACKKRGLKVDDKGLGIWWLRSPVKSGDGKMGQALTTGYSSGASGSWVKISDYCIRPAFILPYDVAVDSNSLVIG